MLFTNIVMILGQGQYDHKIILIYFYIKYGIIKEPSQLNIFYWVFDLISTSHIFIW